MFILNKNFILWSYSFWGKVKLEEELEIKHKILVDLVYSKVKETIQENEK